jgi:hypothetical protein
MSICEWPNERVSQRTRSRSDAFSGQLVEPVSLSDRWSLQMLPTQAGAVTLAGPVVERIENAQWYRWPRRDVQAESHYCCHSTRTILMLRIVPQDTLAHHLHRGRHHGSRLGKSHPARKPLPLPRSHAPPKPYLAACSQDKALLAILDLAQSETRLTSPFRGERTRSRWLG